MKKMIILLLAIILPVDWCFIDESFVNARDLPGQEASRGDLAVGNNDREGMDGQPSGIKIPVFKEKIILRKDARKFCAGKRLDVSKLEKMKYESCMKKQRNGYSNIEELNEKYAGKAFYKDMIYPYCLNEWIKGDAVDVFNMAYCLKKEIIGVKKILQYQKKYDKDKVTEIAEKSLIRYGSWQKAAFEVLRYFE